MASNNDVVRARIDGHIKEEATNVLAGMGLSVSDAIRILLTRIAADKALPFDINRAQPKSDTKKP
ncbi:type II toxin-antitoxin system RelB/DinJ family antitoxin [Aeromonas dhakensis]|uniref:type II toxin-antitoxin system RelB/DinJ family antitoxin n=1 Tax=Aeromonas dhakensis TaxID=196024 RepID=UPI00208F5717|nr:type II toxin-antitoxin system RelB/DinJ family antitoxin [Aeromonas dhakensis]USP11896.1 type II toxin-antitoxin system RelB/DinJ family antitoxin [Aeromonas dhakensis]